jgi:hypothetical protein
MSSWREWYCCFSLVGWSLTQKEETFGAAPQPLLSPPELLRHRPPQTRKTKRKRRQEYCRLPFLCSPSQSSWKAPGEFHSNERKQHCVRALGRAVEYHKGYQPLRAPASRWPWASVGIPPAESLLPEGQSSTSPRRRTDEYCAPSLAYVQHKFRAYKFDPPAKAAQWPTEAAARKRRGVFIVKVVHSIVAVSRISPMLR